MRPAIDRWRAGIIPITLALWLLVPGWLRADAPPIPPGGPGVVNTPTDSESAVGRKIQDLLTTSVRLAKDRRTIYWSIQSTSTVNGQGTPLELDKLGLGNLVDAQLLANLNTAVLRMKSDREEDLLKVLEIITALDRPKKQVGIKVIVAEFEVDTDRYLKTQGRTVEPDLFKTALSGLFELDHSKASLNDQERTDMGYRLFLIQGRRLQTYLATQKTSSRFHIVSEPHVVVNHGETAKVFVGKGVNFINLETSVQGQKPFETFTEESIGLSIGVTPYLYSDGRVGFQLDEEFSDLLLFNPDLRKQGQRTNRGLHTFATVPSGYTLALGGMLERRKNTERKTVPVLSRIPILKDLFRWESRDSKTIELVLFITPEILDPTQITGDALDTRMENLVREGNHAVIRGGYHAKH